MDVCWEVGQPLDVTIEHVRKKEVREFKNDMRHDQKMVVEHSAAMGGERPGGVVGTATKQALKRADMLRIRSTLAEHVVVQ